MSELTVFCTTYNTGLQGSLAQEQDLASWLIPVLHETTQENYNRLPDIYAIGVEELLPLHLAFAGLSFGVLVALTDRIESILSAHATSISPNREPERFRLVSRTSRVGVALWVFAREKTTQGRLGKAVTSSVGLWRLGLGNKSAVGIRLPVMRGAKEGGWETLTFVTAHLEAHDKNIKLRNEQYNTILSSLIFYPGDALAHPVQPFQTSHLFIMGDLNYRLTKLPQAGVYPTENGKGKDLIALEREREALVALDTLKHEQNRGNVFGGMREGDLTRFAPTYKRVVGQVEGYSKKRIPGWTDRILFASHTDPAELFSPNAPETPASTTQITQFNSTPELTISDHKPVYMVVTLPPVRHNAASPSLAPVLPPPPPPSRPRPAAKPREELIFWDIVGSVLDRLIGWPWTLLVLLGFGNEKAGMGVSAFLTLIWGVWWSGVFSGSA